MSAHVKIDGLTITYRDDAGQETAAVRDATIELPRGETLGIVGESGSGKSTLARSLLAHARAGARFAAGSVHLGGTDVLALAGRELRRYRGGRAAMVPQNPLSSLTPHMTIGAQLEELVRLHTQLSGKAVHAHALSLMERTGLPDPELLAKRYPHEISGGQRQRAVIAAALIGKPELIVLDEPTTALDKTVEARVLQLVADVQRDLGATLVYVSHDLNVIRALCSRIAVMKDGSIIEQGEAAGIFNAPGNAYTRSLIQAIPRIDVDGPPPPPAQSPTRLEVRNLRFSYHRPSGFPFRKPRAMRPTLDDISLSLRKGETLGLVGESGSGKSTVASLIAGAVSGHEGRIMLGGETVSGAARTRSRDMRRRIQMVFQDPLSALNPAHTVEEILVRPLRLHFGLSPAAAREKAAAALHEMELGPDFLSRRPRQLSGGQQQRVGFARALAAEPDLLICDEVTSALDVTIQANMLSLFLKIQRERAMTCIFISHDLAVIARVSHRIAVLEKGQLREIGDRDSVLHSPANAYTRRLLAAADTHLRTGEDRTDAPPIPQSLSA
ncbi:ABC transporter ATP-binding protein [Labrenzia sp. 011]|uniref:dipeptide ABC transporter ATP-binding protein n=1 Tax=Labrenzia sp. 011 TaxID=2171494 RepID=UPI000D51AAE5|nr:ABC transporter ATP-binding protein [Labrenzia sp. 011]PVB59359.1 ABC transporter ATP-binding protein [Labrenzia sp. 011]